MNRSSTSICLVALVSLVLGSVFVASVSAGNDYLWGEIGPNDYKLAKDTVKKAFVLGLVQSKKYVFKQSNNLDALTITAIRVTDKKSSDGATAQLTSGGPGSKGATITFKSQRGKGIKDVVEIWGR
ncbi:probable salivary secreted peptide [Scaptodrosophila lebanonensis]|uniref:Probable salivary secreted peptide n=1 Tax=Drosophila lebanonensis TaxID=7225 RepID=A0A6J2U7M9_DROLE|nr:probable salivary secreted peptide [Scaptodrosophila lebanonensis]